MTWTAHGRAERAAAHQCQAEPIMNPTTNSTARAPANAGRQAASKAPDLNNRRALAEQYVPYVRSIAGKIRTTVAKEIDFEDLVEYGMIGLLEAADRFDPDYGASFMTFAYYRIRGAIYDGLRGMGWMSRAEYAKARFAERANEYLQEVAAAHEASAMPSENSFGTAIGDLASTVEGLATVYVTTLDGAEGLQVEDGQTPLPEEALGLQQARRLVREAVEKLPDQERQLLELYYYKDMRLQDVGSSLGFSKSWTSRLHAKVVDKLRRQLEDQLT